MRRPNATVDAKAIESCFVRRSARCGCAVSRTAVGAALRADVVGVSTGVAAVVLSVRGIDESPAAGVAAVPAALVDRASLAAHEIANVPPTIIAPAAAQRRDGRRNSVMLARLD
jgi:hypothetical protein